MLKVYIVSSAQADEVSEVRRLLAARGFTEVSESSSADLAVAVGGDRAVLDAVQALGDCSTPILGLSCGGASYLTSASVDDFGSALEAVERGEYEAVPYTKLKGVVNSSAAVYALNEIAVFPSRSASLMSYQLVVDGDLVWADRADGVLVSTPLGSTAYALSAGGALIFEGARVLEVVPVNSVNPSKRPLVLPDTSVVEVRVISCRYPCEVVADGSTRVRVRQAVKVSSAEAPARLVKLHSKPSVRETLREKVAEALDMPPSAKFVLKILELKGPMGVRELVEETRLPERTVRHALSELMERELVRRVHDTRDLRRVYYELVR